MTNEEAARILDPETRREEFEKYQNRKDYMDAVRAACRIGAEALRADHFTDTTKTVPLTPEQLLEMDGRPIWIEHDSDPKYNHVWMIWNNEIGMRHNLAGYNIFWRAYAYPHAHIDREKWEPCGKCGKQNCDNCLYSDYLSSVEPCKSCYNAKEWKPMTQFCGECGRPLTEEAWAELEKRLRGVVV